MSIRIFHEEAYNTHDVYQVRFYDDTIKTTVTDEASIVSQWISKMEHIHGCRLHQLIVGLDVEWRPNFSRNGTRNPVATLQLCVGRSCLIFQILHAQEIPDSLCYFLSNQDYTYVGVGIDSDADKLMEDYDLDVGCTVDLRQLAAQRWDREDVKNMGLARLAREVMDVDFNGKPKRVTLGRWDTRWLNEEQVMYGCIDAFMSFEIGRSLRADRGI